MQYQQILPSPRLKNYIRYFWALESDDNSKSEKKLLPLADGCPGIIFQRSSFGSFSDPSHDHLPEVFLYGQTVKPTEINLGGKFQTVGVCFYPYTLKSIFGFDANELTDSCLDLTLLLTNNFKEPLLNASSPYNQIEIFSTHLYSYIQKSRYHIDPATQFALSQIVQSKGNLPLRDLQKKLKLSERGFQRKFNQHVGISPKLFSRVCRFQAALHQLKNNDYANLSDLAFDNGYADQSHFIRSFKEFAGFSPYQFQKNHRKIAENFSLI
jgi:AraC-like DNA-binding protein